MNIQKSAIRYSDFSSAEIAAMLMESLAAIRAYATGARYRQNGDFPRQEVLENGLSDASNSMKKRLLKLHFQLKRKLSMRAANLLLHRVTAKLLKDDPAQKHPRIEYSEKEAAIRSSRAAWVKARKDAEALRLAYVQEKGEFYKR